VALLARLDVLLMGAALRRGALLIALVSSHVVLLDFRDGAGRAAVPQQRAQKNASSSI